MSLNCSNGKLYFSAVTELCCKNTSATGDQNEERNLLLAACVCLFAMAMYAADNPNMGTWKLNQEKSKIPAGGVMNTTVVYTADGDNIKVTTDGMNGDKQPVQTEWVGKFDGKDYPVTGSGAPSGTTRAYKPINDRKMELTNKVNGKETVEGTIEVAKDGKTRTVVLESTGDDGKKTKSKGVYDKQ